ncbi:MAG: cupin domain-containing protein [Candidatus Binatia bacterium]
MRERVDLRFRAESFFTGDDGTQVSPFLNPRDAMSAVPWDLLHGFSLAMGRLAPGEQSAIHVHPFVERVVVVLSGALELLLKDVEDPEPYRIALAAHDAAVMRPGSFQQLRNPGPQRTDLLYVVSPPFQFEPGSGGDPLYTDAIVVGRSWEALQANGWTAPKLSDPAASFDARQCSVERVQRMKARAGAPRSS